MNDHKYSKTYYHIPCIVKYTLYKLLVTWNRRLNLKIHLKNKHGIQERKRGGHQRRREKTIQCEVCNRRLISEEQIEVCPLSRVLSITLRFLRSPSWTKLTVPLYRTKFSAFSVAHWYWIFSTVQNLSLTNPNTILHTKCCRCSSYFELFLFRCTCRSMSRTTGTWINRTTALYVKLAVQTSIRW